MHNIDREIHQGGQLTREAALEIYREAATPESAQPLLAAAARLRDRIFGRDVHYMATMAPILACALKPRCEYCDWWRARVIQRSRIVAGAAALAARGVRRVLLVGGSRDGDYDDSLFDIVQRIRDEGIDLDLEINVGGSLSTAGVERLRGLGVVGVTASLETVNEALFLRHKPGDSLVARRRLLAAVREQGLELRSIMMIGLGESIDDRIDHLFELRAQPSLRHLMISRFSPRPDTPLAEREQAPLHEWVRTIALARLVLPHVRIGMAGGVDPSELPLWYRAGGGNQIFAMGVHTMPPPPVMQDMATDLGNGIHLVDRRPMLAPQLAALGLSASFDDRMPATGLAA